MKKIFIIPYLALFLLLSFGCQDQLKKDFVNPGVYSPTTNIPAGMFSAMMSRTRTFVNDYGEFWYHADAGGMISHLHLTQRFLRSDYSWFSDANNVTIFYTVSGLEVYFYGPNSDFKELPLMEQEIGKMSDAGKADNAVYVTLSKMVRAYRASKAVDLNNSVPYSEGLKGVDGIFFPKFDDPKEIYESIITDLDKYADLAVQQEAAMSADGKNVFKQQDIVFSGDVVKWKQWANAVRLRLAVRISGVDEAFAKTAISQIIAKNNLPTEDLLIPPSSWCSESKNYWKLGMAERDYAAFVPPTIMFKLDRNLDHKYTPGIDDPRLPVFFLPNRDTLYMPTSMDFAVGQKIYNAVRADNQAKYNFGSAYFNTYNYYNELDRYMKYNAYSLWNPATMVRNVEPVRAFTRAEVDLLLAEVELKSLGTTSKSVVEHVKDAVRNSIKYWYYINSFSNWDAINSTNIRFLKPTAPSQSVIDQYANVIADDYNAAASQEDKMEVIIGQKYIHLSVHDYLEVFSELRRTRHPKIPLIKFSESMNIAPQIERWPYPAAESATNKDAMSKVASEDNYTSPIFWVPSGLRNVSYYESALQDKNRFIRYKGVPESFPK